MYYYGDAFGTSPSGLLIQVAINTGFTVNPKSLRPEGVRISEMHTYYGLNEALCSF